LIVLIIKVIFEIIFFDKEQGLNIFLLTNKECKKYKLNGKKKDHLDNDPFPIYLGDEKI
jgi:hypothetical protein